MNSLQHSLPALTGEYPIANSAQTQPKRGLCRTGLPGANLGPRKYASPGQSYHRKYNVQSWYQGSRSQLHRSLGSADLASELLAGGVSRRELKIPTCQRLKLYDLS